jgi:hypothetical protein
MVTLPGPWPEIITGHYRNYILTGNPFYPLPRLGFKGPLAFDDTVWIETLRYPLEMVNAGFGEYHLWLFSVLIAVGVLGDT